MGSQPHTVVDADRHLRQQREGARHRSAGRVERREETVRARRRASKRRSDASGGCSPPTRRRRRKAVPQVAHWLRRSRTVFAAISIAPVRLTLVEVTDGARPASHARASRSSNSHINEHVAYLRLHLRRRARRERAPIGGLVESASESASGEPKRRTPRAADEPVLPPQCVATPLHRAPVCLRRSVADQGDRPASSGSRSDRARRARRS